MKQLGVVGLLLTLAVMGCSKATPLAPSSSVQPSSVDQQVAAATGRANPGRPDYEEAYYGGDTYTINAIEVPNHAPEKAQADIYEVVYPPHWQRLGVPPPQCNPCDHAGDGIDPSDYHDHVLDSVPSSPGHGEYSALWHVWVVAPRFNGNPDHDRRVEAHYASLLPLKSEQAVQRVLRIRLPDGTRLARMQDTQFYFLCAVVNPNAANH